MPYSGPNYSGKMLYFGGIQGGFTSIAQADPLWAKPGSAISNQFPSNMLRDDGSLDYYQGPIGNASSNGSTLNGQNWYQRIAAMHTWCVNNNASGPTIQLFYPSVNGDSESTAQFIQYLQAIAPYCNNAYMIVANELSSPTAGCLASLGGAGSTGWDGLAGMVKLCRQYLPSGTKLGLNDYNAGDYSSTPPSAPLTSSLFNYNKMVQQYQACASLGAPMDWVGFEGYWLNHALTVTDYQGNNIAPGITAYASAAQAMAIATNCPIMYTEFTPFDVPASGFPEIYSTLEACWQAALGMMVNSQYIFGVTAPWLGFRLSQSYRLSTKNWLWNDKNDGTVNGDGTTANIVPTLTWMQGYVPQILTGAPPPTGPFGGVAPTLPTTIIGSAYDYGGQGIGYNFVMNGGQTVASAYRSDGFQNLKTNTDTFSANPWVVGYGVTGNWTAYTVNVPFAGSFSFQLRCGTATGGSFHISIDGSNTPTVAVAAQGAWDTPNEWVTVSVPGQYNMTAGTHLLKVLIDVSNIDINLLVVSYSGAVRVLHFDTKSQGGGPSSLAIQNTIGQTLGSQLLLFIETYNNVIGTFPTISSVADTVNGTFSLINGPVTQGHVTSWVYGRNNIVASGQAGDTATCTLSAAMNGSLALALIEVTGQNLSASVDVTNSAHGTGTTASVALTTTNAFDSILVFGGISSEFANGSPNFNNIYNLPNLAILLDILPVTATGTYTNTPLIAGGSPDWTLQSVALKSAGTKITLGGNCIPAVLAKGTITVVTNATQFAGTQQSVVVASGAHTVQRNLAGRTN